MRCACGEIEGFEERSERARIRLAHRRIGDHHAVEHVGVHAVPLEHRGPERIVGEERELHPAAQRFERGERIVEQRRVERREEGLDQLLARHECFGLVQHAPVVAVDDEAVAPHPGLLPHPVADLGRAHRGRGPPDAGPPVGEGVVEVERDRPDSRDRHPPSLSQARATVSP